jgi:hypothetical protein
MIAGLPPFYCDKKSDLVRAICTKEPKYKEFMSSDAKDLI